MGIDLSKGQRAPIATQAFTVGLGWDVNASDTGTEFDLDASVFLLGANDKLVSDAHFIFYNNLKSPDGAVAHTGDNRTGEGDGDDEAINIDLSKIDSSVTQILVVATIHDADTRSQSFGQVRNAYIRIVDQNNNTELMKFELDEDYSVESAVQFGRIYNRNGEWKFEAIGTGSGGGLAHYVNQYQ